jgi:hypothetical protein
MGIVDTLYRTDPKWMQIQVIYYYENNAYSNYWIAMSFYHIDKYCKVCIADALTSKSGGRLRTGPHSNNGTLMGDLRLVDRLSDAVGLHAYP